MTLVSVLLLYLISSIIPVNNVAADEGALCKLMGEYCDLQAFEDCCQMDEIGHYLPVWCVTTWKSIFLGWDGECRKADGVQPFVENQLFRTAP